MKVGYLKQGSLTLMGAGGHVPLIPFEFGMPHRPFLICPMICPMMYIRNAPTDIWDAPTDIWNAPTDIWNVPTDIRNAPTDIWNAPTDIWNAPTHIWNAPTDI